MTSMSVEEKLKKFQFVCEDKLRKIELLKITHEKNDKILQTLTATHSDQVKVAQLNFKVAKMQLNIVNLREANQKEVEYQDQLRIKIDNSTQRLNATQDSITEMTSDIQEVKNRLEQRLAELSELCSGLRETVAMGAEEARTLSCCIQEATLRSQADQQVEWMGRLLRATAVQTQDAQRKLAFLQGYDHQKEQPQQQQHQISQNYNSNCDSGSHIGKQQQQQQQNYTKHGNIGSMRPRGFY